jgi:hypothetical protein
MFMTREQLEAELDALDRDWQLPTPSPAEVLAVVWQKRQEFLEARVRELPTPPTHTMHPSEYPVRGPKYDESLGLLSLQQFTVEDLRRKDAKGTPIRIFPGRP